MTSAISPPAATHRHPLSFRDHPARTLHVELFERAARDECIATICTQRLIGLQSELAEVKV